MAERSTANVFGRSLAGIAGSNPAGNMDVCIVCCTARTNGTSQDNQVRIKYRERERERVRENQKKKILTLLVLEV